MPLAKAGARQGLRAGLHHRDGWPYWLTTTGARRGLLTVVTADTGTCVCCGCAASTFWFGVIDSPLELSNFSTEGTPITCTCTCTCTCKPLIAWLGRGALRKREIYCCNIEALRQSTVAGLLMALFCRRLTRSLAVMFQPRYPGEGRLQRLASKSRPGWWGCRGSGSTGR